jgi:hypothetical protein
MNEREMKVRREISGILADKSTSERRIFIRDIKAFLYTENRRIRDKEMETLLKEKDQQVYGVRVY